MYMHLRQHRIASAGFHGETQVTRAEDWITDFDDRALFDLFMLRCLAHSTGAFQGSLLRFSVCDRAISTVC